MFCLKCLSESARDLVQGQTFIEKECIKCNCTTEHISKSVFFSKLEKTISDNFIPLSELSNWQYHAQVACGSDAIPMYNLDNFIEWLTEDSDNQSEIHQVLISTINDSELFFLNDGSIEYNKYSTKWDKEISPYAKESNFETLLIDFYHDLFHVITDGNRLKHDVIRTIAENTPLYRAREASDPQKIKDIESDFIHELGPVPPSKASAQRMTRAGESAIYCSLERETCLSEIRPIVGDIVISGVFSGSDQINLLDLNSFVELSFLDYDFFSSDYVDKSHKCYFLKSLVDKISKPKGRSGDFTYLICQAFFRYIQLKFSGQISGIIFNSIQTAYTGRNVVLFPEYSLPVGHKDISASNRAVLAFDTTEGSIVFHRILGVKLDHKEYESIDLLEFMERNTTL